MADRDRFAKGEGSMGENNGSQSSANGEFICIVD
jgi:hypothetical protein